ncbi:aminotransferase class V-fold PLP-dependent enzyme [Alcaligenaceae bacterium]|nr:aminotransferase class V-fold PLP-dependent enzyme [Alcaligenaceae bacterium]
MKTLPDHESQNIRKIFPVMEQCTYLDLGGRAPVSTAVRAAVDSYLDDCVHGRVDKDALFEETENVRSRFAGLVNADADEITFTKNTSEGLNIICTGIDWQPGDNLVFCPELEHPNNIYLWLNLERKGVEIRMIRQKDGFMPIDDMINAIDERTRLLTVSSVSFIPGFRTDMEKLGRACRERNVLFLIDGTQSVGVLHTDVQRMHIDALAVSTQKGLMGLYGMGFLYVRKAVAERMSPTYIARFGIDIGNEGALEYDFGGGGFSLLPGARRFDLGNYNFAGVRAVGESLAFITSIGTRRIESHVTALAHGLARGFLDLGLPVCGGEPGEHTAQTVSVGLQDPGACDGDTVERLRQLYGWLAENGVKLSIRRDLLRFSMHVYNDMMDVDRTLELANAFLEKRMRMKA